MQYPVSLAKELPEVKIELLNVQEPALVREHASRTAQEISHIQADAANRVLRDSAQLPDMENVPHETQWRVGSPAEKVVRQAKDGRCTAIIMGTRGLGTLASVLLGSVAYKVIHGANAPVTLIK